ncbi:MAG: GGDEF domain-containing protein [Cytophagales bacterium]|nr:GGDEF domain-containing protein [Armatimonadota bacterium]
MAQDPAEHSTEETHFAEMRAINERLVIASVRQQELAELASKNAEAARKSGEIYRLLARNFPNGVVLLFDHELRHLLADGRGLASLGISKETVEGKTIWEGFPLQTCLQIEPAYRAALAGETSVLEVRLAVQASSQEGRERTYQIQVLPVRDDAGNILAGMAMTQDVTEQRRAEASIRWQAHHDALTGLPNRALLRDRMEQVFALSERTGEFSALLFLDLDRFKQINDTFGHSVGDRLLQAVAERLTRCLRTEDTVARIGGDEFLVLLPGLRTPRDAERVAQKITAQFTAPFLVDRQAMTVTASVGVSLFPFDGRDAESLLKNADTAMYRSKGQGRGGYQLYHEAVDGPAPRRGKAVK